MALAAVLIVTVTTLSCISTICPTQLLGWPLNVTVIMEPLEAEGLLPGGGAGWDSARRPLPEVRGQRSQGLTDEELHLELVGLGERLAEGHPEDDLEAAADHQQRVVVPLGQVGLFVH